MFKLKLKKQKDVRQPGPAHGINSSSNALFSNIVLGAGVALIPIAAIFAILLLIREPAIEAKQVERIGAAFAAQQATHIERYFQQLGERMEGAAGSPLAFSAIASQQDEDIRLVEQTMANYFPEAITLRLIALGELGTAELVSANEGLRNHIELDLVRRTGAGDNTPPEAYRFEDRFLTSLARKITHPRIADRSAVILLTLDNERISAELATLGTGLGRSVLRQVYGTKGSERRTDVASFGTADDSLEPQLTQLSEGNWELAFTPSPQLVSELAIDKYSLLGFLAIIITGVIGGFALLGWRYTAALSGELERVLAAADKKTPLELSIPQLVEPAKQLRRATLRGARQVGTTDLAGNSDRVTPRQSSSEFTNPLFQNTTMIDEESGDGVLELDLTQPGPATAELSSGSFPDHIFRAYDIRGVADTELNDEMVASIGAAIGTWAGELGEQSLVVGADGRASSPRIKTTLIKALLESGRDVVDIGQVPTPLMYFATQQLASKSGIMVTGSHNPADFNGLKVVLKQQTIAAGGVQEIRARVLSGKFSRGTGRIVREDIVPAYLDEVVGDIAIAEPLKIVVDAGNGVTGGIAPQLLEELGCEVIPLYCDVDGRFPNHPPDTSNEANLADLCATVVEQGADLGVAFDGDGDRVAVVTSRGEIVRSDRLLMLYAEDVVSRNPGADVVFDVKCSRELAQLISRRGGRPVLWKTGHAFMKEKMRETGALLGGEFSGHMFFGERWYGFDDGMYAAGRLAEILSTSGETLEQALGRLPETVSTAEILIPMEESRKFQFMAQLAGVADFTPGKVNTLDGIRVDYSEGWGLLRASNTTAALTARFEASSAAELEGIKQTFRDQVAQVDADLAFDV